MRLENAYRFMPRTLVLLLLSAGLVNCSSVSHPIDLPSASGGSGNATASTGGSSGSAVTSMGGSGPLPGTGGSAPIGGSAAIGGSGPISGGSGGSGGAIASGGSGNSSAGGSAQGGGSTGTCPVINDFQTWPSGKAPADIGKLAVKNFLSHTMDAYGGAGYAWTFTYVAALQFTKLTGDSATNAQLIKDFDRYASGGTAAPSNATTATVDDRAFGDLPLEIFIENSDDRSKKLGLDRADQQWAGAGSDGITKDARYWADDMFMITGLQVYAYRATKDVKYLTRAAKTMIAYQAALQQSDGNFWHTKQSKAYWGRANGWVAAGQAELLTDLPAGGDRDMVMAGYKKQMDGLLPLQINDGSADNGMWRQVLDLKTSNPESSCTAMFTFALVTGIRNGWLTDAKYITAARNGWLALGNKTSSMGVLDKVCPGTGQADAGTLQSQQMFYAGIALGSNDQHGQAPLLWAARALMRPDCSGVH
ncbi:MAG TPA: glycoside hydrolase family 88 protein [Polyangiaceae bacterium]|nr:glycoside hydrolase family 88 protein [Polyangiaceae bacterium]